MKEKFSLGLHFKSSTAPGCPLTHYLKRTFTVPKQLIKQIFPRMCELFEAACMEIKEISLSLYPQGAYSPQRTQKADGYSRTMGL